MDRFGRPEYAKDPDHAVVYRVPNEFVAWPFNKGFWQTASGDLLVAFMRNDCEYRTATDVSHRRRVDAFGARVSTLRSEDGGQTWDVATLSDLAHYPDTSDELFAGGRESYEDVDPFDFFDQDVLLASGTAPDYWSQNSRAWLRLSSDGGHTWREPIFVPLEGFQWLHGRSSTLTRPDGACLLFLTANRPDGTDGRPVVYASLDGGVHWCFLSYMTPPSDDHLSSCPKAVLLPDGRIVAAVRCQRTRRSAWTEILASDDGGRSWEWMSRVNDVGAPADLVQMHDGRLACVYGYRMPPYGVRARISEDDGRTWDRELIIRDDGGSWDLGYPRAVELEPGRLLVVYYMNLASDDVQVDGGVRHLARSVFAPP